MILDPYLAMFWSMTAQNPWKIKSVKIDFGFDLLAQYMNDWSFIITTPERLQRAAGESHDANRVSIFNIARALVNLIYQVVG